MKSLLKLLLAVFLLALPAAAQAGTVTIKGSDTMVILGQRWAEAFMKKNPNIKVQVTGGGSGVGLAALQNGTTDIAMSSREMKKAEADKLRARYKAPPAQRSVAKDGVTFYVHQGNPVSALTTEQLMKIYVGDITSWKQVGGADAPIVAYSRENSSGTYVFVKDMVLDGEDFAPAIQTLPGTAAVVNAVSKEKNSLGYGGAAYAEGIKELKVKKGNEEIAPSADNIKSGKYPLARDLFFYLRAEPTGDIKAFIDFALSPEGQAIVTQVGYFLVK
ncbi:phosphate ABC transporter substrate-binding protein [Myxococcus virescens]|uniref:Phosphate-binding protein n=1 Tax=Myxococcus virescens TaxID=83456 RepID=A0A511HJB8_9BACT|nr:phosphate ABC transporter substrate-binding protein [Myxococcus virescens]GEL73474.1 phosphate-binding protein [Myxococcus virescens]SDF20500.1 phosphate ABC transporter substrate-binding protein, PhoT family [Myxococcus virescens]